MEPRPRLAAAAPEHGAATSQNRERLFALIEEVVRAQMGEADGERLLARLAEHLQKQGAGILAGINAHREDVEPVWDRRKASIYGESVGVGAVHLELGTWTAFPDRRTHELVEADDLAEFIRLDVNEDYRPDVVADVTALPFRSGCIDRVASNSLVEHVPYPREVMEESYRVLRPGGVMVVVMPFVWCLHGYPDDYVRLTPRYFERICREIGFVEVSTEVASSGGTFNVLHNTAKMASVDARAQDAAALRELHELAVLMLGTLIPMDQGFLGGLEVWFHSVRCLARKPGTYEPSGRTREPRRRFVERALDLFADPITRAPLELSGGRLVDGEYRTAYEVRADTPIFTEPRQLDGRRGPLAASRREVDAWVRRHVPDDARRHLPDWARRAGGRALGR